MRGNEVVRGARDFIVLAPSPIFIDDIGDERHVAPDDRLF